MGETGLITQRTETDCGVCCFAMALGKTWDDFFFKLPGELQKVILEKGMNVQVTRDTLLCHGYVEDEQYVRRIFSPHWGTVGATKNLLWGRRAVVSVHSRNVVDGWHFIYYDGRKVWDPSNKERYPEDFTDCEPHEMYLFLENP